MDFTCIEDEKILICKLYIFLWAWSTEEIPYA